ncbi:MAG: acetyltransferase [Betaproteobacteria bacterium]|nr:acetyltransferase [Betaproteobacteria bacterium]MCC6853620.1 acetyltransferase [Rubrivivax sp.]
MSGWPVIVVGAGGHGCVVADALLATGVQVLGFIDEDEARHGSHCIGLPVLGGDRTLERHVPEALRLANGIGGVGGVRAAGEPGRRESVQRRLETRGWIFLGVRHPSAIVAPSAAVDESAQLLAGSVVQPGARVGRGAIINTRSVVEHDSVVGAFAHVAPGAVLCGGVVLGDGVHVGAGAVVRQGLRIAASTVIGVGAAVVRDCSGGTWVGVPARRRGSLA